MATQRLVVTQRRVTGELFYVALQLACAQQFLPNTDAQTQVEFITSNQLLIMPVN